MSRGEDFDVTELFDFADQLLVMAEKQMPKETRKFIQTEGNKLRRATLDKAKELTQKKTGNYVEGIKRGKVYKFEGDATVVRVYGSSPHAHLIEYGHRNVTKSGEEVGFTPGKRVFEKTRKAFEQEFVDDCDAFIDEMLEKGLK
ncbi:HK97 gp10 family phage protein [Paenibacillus sp. MWE-103]|uniref:HK97 gp10 family phage protein n=1 Tax=Paenibacillus artemisiicola TaxID=1172618 RepID=A0ABS3WGV9_9BACL|nr:HK97 gp10 family phage protein [Paenibacillus artemisiicola]MBO7747356.1 HK97 gp10 family phage protein [Paenibacillus artemisiicola]